jgi:hypothetical protein
MFRFSLKAIPFVIAAIVLCGLSAPVLAADDVVIMKNGDRITGEVKKLHLGDLHVDPAYGENIFIIDWAEVERIESKASFLVETSRGQRMTGSVNTDPTESTRIIVEETTGPVQVPHQELVFLNPVDKTFASRMSASVDFGLSLTKANEASSVNGRGAWGYLAEMWSTDWKVDLFRNTQKDVPRTQRTETSGDFRRFFAEKWFGIGAVGFLQSDELSLDLRSTTMGGVGRHLYRDNRWVLSAIGGAGWTRESFFEETGQPTANSAEAVGILELNAFDIGDVGVTAAFSVFPSLTESGRLRMDLGTDFKWEIIDDLFFRVGFSNNYDNKPVGEEDSASKNDYVFSTSVGWSW